MVPMVMLAVLFLQWCPFMGKETPHLYNGFVLVLSVFQRYKTNPQLDKRPPSGNNYFFRSLTWNGRDTTDYFCFQSGSGGQVGWLIMWILFLGCHLNWSEMETQHVLTHPPNVFERASVYFYWLCFLTKGCRKYFLCFKWVLWNLMLPSKERLAFWPSWLNLLIKQGKDKTAEERRIAICIFDDVVEHCSEAALK